MNGVGKIKLFGSATLMAVTIVAFVAGCGSAGGNSSAGSSGGTANTGQSTATATQGVKLFQQNCAMCHSTGTNTLVGPGLKGIMSRQSLPNGKSVNDDNVQNWIRTGGGGMPGFPQLTDQQRADIVAYLHTLS